MYRGRLICLVVFINYVTWSVENVIFSVIFSISYFFFSIRSHLAFFGVIVNRQQLLFNVTSNTELRYFL